MDFSSGGKRLSGFLKWWLLAEWIIREVVIRKVEMIRRAHILVWGTDYGHLVKKLAENQIPIPNF